ncbi:hypothetical protein ACLB2K_069468 [Fragaria x ananassa]
MADKYGPLFTIKLGVHRALVVSSWEVAKECLTTNDKSFAIRPKALGPEIMGYNAMFGFIPYGPYWRQVRKLTTLHILSNHKLELLKHARESEVKMATKLIFDMWEQNKGVSNKVLVEMKRCSSISEVVGLNVARNAERSGTGTRYGYAGLFLGGTDATTVTLTWALAYLLLNNPKVLKKAQLELDHHVGKERQVNDSDVKNLIYLQDIIKETLRLDPAGALPAPHESSEDCTVRNYYVTAGTRLLINISKIQRDPNVWLDPCQFQPERFLTTHKNVDVRGQSFELIPFGSGRRICPGISLALQVIHLTLAHLQHGFEITAPSDEPVDMDESSGMTNMKTTSLEALLTPRLHPKLYDNVD